MPNSLYVHIPFCSSICKYCDFVKLLYRDEWAFPYVDALLKELELKYKDKKFKTIYIGGGTPNCLDRALLEKVLDALSSHLEDEYEFTIECNPEFVDENLAELLRIHGINRVSMGLETSDESLLSKMGRHHDFDKVKEAVGILKQVSIDNISIDIIYALPGQSKDMLDKDIDAVLSLDVPHISCYSYIQEDHSIWTHEGIEEASQDIQGDYFIEVENRLCSSGYNHYEISSYCKKGYASKHNITYWKDEEYGAIGLGASGYENHIRYKNTTSLPKFLKGERIASEEYISQEDDVKYYLMTNLRLKEGFSLEDFKKRFGYSILDAKKEIIAKLVKDGLLEEPCSRLAPTYKGMRLLDSVLLALF